MSKTRTFLVCFCLASAVICGIAGDFWAAAICAMNAGWIAG